MPPDSWDISYTMHEVLAAPWRWCCTSSWNPSCTRLDTQAGCSSIAGDAASSWNPGWMYGASPISPPICRAPQNFPADICSAGHLDHPRPFGPFWETLSHWGHFGPFGPPWAISANLAHLGHPGPPWAIWATLGHLGHVEPLWVTLGHFGSLWAILATLRTWA